MSSRKGFTLIEILIYISLFATLAVFLVNILSTTTRVQSRQASLNELNQQLTFVASTIERLVRNASLIENEAGVASTSLVLRMSSSTLDPTVIFVDPSSSALFIQEGEAPALAMTNNKVKVTYFKVVKYENPGGRAVVQVDLTLENNTNNPQLKFSRTLQTAIARTSAANFDYSLIPNSPGTYDVGSVSYTWKDAFFAGRVGIGTTNPGAKLGISGGDAAIKDAGYGWVVKTPNGTACYRLGVDNSGVVTSTAVVCP